MLMDLPVQMLNLIWCECVICVGSVRCPSPTPRTLKNSRDAYIKKLNEIYLRNLEKVVCILYSGVVHSHMLQRVVTTSTWSPLAHGHH